MTERRFTNLVWARKSRLTTITGGIG